MKALEVKVIKVKALVLDSNCQLEISCKLHKHLQ